MIWEKYAARKTETTEKHRNILNFAVYKIGKSNRSLVMEHALFYVADFAPGETSNIDFIIN